jgi:hypothetical protein
MGIARRPPQKKAATRRVYPAATAETLRFFSGHRDSQFMHKARLQRRPSEAGAFLIRRQYIAQPRNAPRTGNAMLFSQWIPIPNSCN